MQVVFVGPLSVVRCPLKDQFSCDYFMFIQFVGQQDDDSAFLVDKSRTLAMYTKQICERISTCST